MDLKHRRVLINFRTKIENIINVGYVLDLLFSSEQFDQDDRETVMSHDRARDQKRKLVDVLLGKENEAVDVLLNALSNKGYSRSLYIEIQNELNKPVSIVEINAILCTTYGVPLPPEQYVPRQHLEEEIRNAVMDLARAAAWVIVYGAGGTGKTSLCAEALRSEDILELFPGGIKWLHSGRFEDDERRMIAIRLFVYQLDIERRWQQPTSVMEAKITIRDILNNSPRCLIVIDDIWDSDIAEVFNINVPLLVSTRDVTPFKKVSGVKREIRVSDGLSANEGACLLAGWTRLEVSELPEEATTLIRQTKGHPLALTLIGAYLNEFPEDWEYCITRLVSIEQETPYKYNSLKEALLIGIKALPPGHQLKYKDLAVFPKGIAFSPEVVAVLWGEDKERTKQILKHFSQKTLLKEGYIASLGSRVYVVHDLQYEVLQEITDTKILHSKMVNRLEVTCAGHWNRLQFHDDYIWRYLPYHLSMAGMDELFTCLYTNLRFLAAAICRVGAFAVVGDMVSYASDVMRSDVNWVTTISALDENVSTLSEIQCAEKKEQEARILEGIIQSALCCGHETEIFKEAQSLAHGKEERFCFLLNPKSAPVLPGRKVQATNFCFDLQIDKSKQHIAVSGKKGDVTLLDCRSVKRKANWSEISPTDHGVRCCFNKTRDILAASTSPKCVRLFKVYDVDGTAELSEVWITIATSSEVWSILLDNDTDFLFVGSADGWVTRYPILGDDAPTQIMHLDGVVRWLTLSCDGSLLGVGAWGLPYMLYSFHNGSSDAIMMTEPNLVERRRFTFINFDTVEIVLLLWNRSLKVWNPGTKEIEKSFLLPGNAACFATDIDADLVAAGDEQGNIKVWRYSNEVLLFAVDCGQQQTHIALYHHPTRDVVESDSCADTTLLTGNINGAITAWPIDTSGALAGNTGSLTHVPTLLDTRQVRDVFAVHFGKEGHDIVVTQDGSLKLEFFVAKGEILEVEKVEVDSTIWSAAISSNGTFVAFGFEDGCTRVYRVSISADGKPHVTEVLKKTKCHQGAVGSIIYSSNDSIVSADSGGFVFFFKLTPNRPTLMKHWRAHEPPVGAILYPTTLQYLPGRKHLVTAGNDHHLKMWDLSDVSKPAIFDVDTQHMVGKLSFVVDPQENIVATFTWKEFIAKVWSLHSRDLLYTLQHQHQVRSCSFCPLDASLLATVDGGGSASIYRIDAEWTKRCAVRKEPLEKISAGTIPLNAISWIPERIALVAADDNRLHVWNCTVNSSVNGEKVTLEPLPLRFGRLGGWDKLDVSKNCIVSKTDGGTLNILRQMKCSDRVLNGMVRRQIHHEIHEPRENWTI